MRCELYIGVLEKYRPAGDWVIAEVGVWKGDLAFTFLDTEPRIKRYYAVDPYKVYDSPIQRKRGWSQDKWDDFYENWVKPRLAQFGDRICFIREESNVAVDLVKESLDMVYIDAKHDHKSVKEDINIWYGKLCEGGILAGHDYDPGRYPEVKRAVDEFAEFNGRKLTAGRRRSADWFMIK